MTNTVGPGACVHTLSPSISHSLTLGVHFEDHRRLTTVETKLCSALVCFLASRPWSDPTIAASSARLVEIAAEKGESEGLDGDLSGRVKVCQERKEKGGVCGASSIGEMAAAEDGVLAGARRWVVDNKLKAVGTLWAGSVIGSLAYNFSNPLMKTSVKIIHARLHAQALTLAALAGCAAVEYYDHKSGEKAKRYEKHVQ